jgi:hypothetical protein
MPSFSSEEFSGAVFRGDAQARHRTHHVFLGHTLEYEMCRKKDREGENDQQNAGSSGSASIARRVLTWTNAAH